MSSRNRIHQDCMYFHALGLAMVAFARLEWAAVYCCEALDPRYVQTVETKNRETGKIRGKSSGEIAADLIKRFKEVADPALRERIVPFAEEFQAIVNERNSLYHAKPITVGEQQRLNRWSDKTWQIDDVNAFSDNCASLGSRLNDLYHNTLEGSSPG